MKLFAAWLAVALVSLAGGNAAAEEYQELTSPAEVLERTVIALVVTEERWSSVAAHWA